MLTYATAGLTVLINQKSLDFAHQVRARLLCAEARYLKVRAAAAALDSKQLREKLVESWLRRFTSDDPLGLTVVCCAWCGRMRTADGKLWLKRRTRMPEIARDLRVSHGICPACRNQKWLSTPVEGEAMVAGSR
jgi:hypothetical protein